VEERAQTDAESIDDACEEDTLNDRPSIVIDDGEECETSVETDTGGEGPSPTKQAFPDAQLLDSWSSTFPTQWRLASPERIPIQAPAIPVHPAGTHKGPEPNVYRRYQPNVKRIRQKETDVPVTDYHSSDEDDEDSDSVRGEELDNCPPNLTKVEFVSNNGPHSIKTMSKRSFSMRSVASTAGSKVSRPDSE